MCSVGFNSQFGMNVTNFQQMQRLRKFGASVRQPAGGMQRFNMDSSLFTTGKTNMFAQSSKTSSLSFNGVQYDNRFAMLNSVQSQNQSASTGKSSGSSFGSTLKMLNNFLGKIFDGKKDGAGKIGQQSLDQINNAQDKQTLSQAIDSANSDSRSLDNQLKADNNTLKAAQNQETQAQQGADKAEQGVDTANQGLDKANQEHSAAQTEVQQAEQGLKSAQTGVSNAQNALDAAKAAATPENPNTAAIAKAESDLQAAKAEEEAAQKRLDEAKQKETEAQSNVDKSEQQVKTAEEQNTQAQSKLENAAANTEQAESTVQNTETQGNEIEQGIQQGEQKMQALEAQSQEQVYGTESEPPRADGGQLHEGQMQEQVYGTDPNQPSKVQDGNAQQNDPFAEQNELMDGKGYSDAEKAEVLKARQDIQNMQPGQTIQCGADTYTMDENGTIHVNDTAGEYTDRESAAMNAGDSAMRGIDSKKRSEAEMEALRQGNKAKQKPSVSVDKQKAANAPQETPVSNKNEANEAPEAVSVGTSQETKGAEEAREAEEAEDKPVEEEKKEMDTSKPGTQWRGKRVGPGSREDVKLERNEDGTITETGISGKRILDEEGKKVLYQEGKGLGYRGGDGAIDYRNGTQTTELDSIKTGATTGYTVISGMSKPGSGGEIHDKDGNLIMTMKDGQFFNAKGKEIKLSKAIDIINDNKGEGFKLVRQLKKKGV